MSARRTTARFSVAAMLIGALSLGGASVAASAAGEPDGLYSATDDDGSAFVQLDKTDATATVLGTVTDLYDFLSVEVVNGVGYAIGTIEVEDDDDIYAFFTWDIVTGAVLTAVPLSVSVPVGELDEVSALDTTRDGLFLTYVDIAIDDDITVDWIGSIDPATGALTLLVEVDVDDDPRIFEGLATNPVDGITYALTDLDDGVPGYSPVDLEAGTVGELVEFPSISEALGNGYFSEGDFDAEGVLWFTYSGAGVSRTDAPLEVGVDATELGDPDITEKAITIGQTVVVPVPPAPVEPQLAATGFPVAPVIGSAAALLIAGAGLMVARRRSAA